MPNTDQKPTKDLPKLSTLDKNIIAATKLLDNPTKSNIANHVVELGATKHIQSVYRRLKQKDYLNRELQEVRAHNLESIQRQHVPKALRKLNSILTQNKDKKLQLQAVNTTLKYGMGEMVNVPTPGVSIGAINVASLNILADVKPKGWW